MERIPESEHPIPLEDICTMETTLIREVKEELPLDTPWVKAKDLSYLYKGELDIMSLERANCQNNPKDWKWGEKGISTWAYAEVYSSISEEEFRTSEYRKCTYLDGTKDAVLFYDADFTGFVFAIIPGTGKPVAVDAGINVVYPKKGYDALTLLSVLRLPEVHWQISVYSDIFERLLHNSSSNRFYLKNYMNDILVPENKRTIANATYQIEKEGHVIKDMQERYDAMKTDYINEVRMRKHDMGQYLFELGNIEDLIRYYIENRNTEIDFSKQIEGLLDDFRSSLGELSSLLDNLSKEEQFGTPEAFSIDNYLSELVNRHNAEGYKITYSIDKSTIIAYNKTNMRDTLEPIELQKPDVEPMPEMEPIEIQDGEAIDNITKIFVSMKTAPPLYVAPNDIQRAINNIVNNARKHGFTDSNRKDYEIKISLSIDVKRNMYQIDFRNNGNPLPEGMNKIRYGIKGEKAGKTAGTGLGGNYVKSFVEHYGGDYDIFMENGWTVVRIYLPIK